MAGTFTHWMVVEEAFDRYGRLGKNHPYFPVVMGLNHYVCLGAVDLITPISPTSSTNT